MTGVPIEKQAEYSVLLDDKVRELVRKHVLEAFNDPNFMDHLTVELLHRKLENRSYGGGSFAQAVRNVIANQMNKY